MAEEKLPKVGDSLGDGWTVTHVSPAKAVNAAGSGTSVITVTEANIIAHKRVGDTLIERNGSSMDELKARMDAVQVPNPNPLTEDGNRVLSPEEILENAKATVYMQTTEGARQARMVNLTASDSAKPKAAIVSANPVVDHEDLKGDEAAAVAAASPNPPAK